jgi:hypothetical protein
VLAGAAFVLLWWLLPPHLYDDGPGSEDARLIAIKDTRTALLAGLVGVGALGTLWVNGRNVRLSGQALRLAEHTQQESHDLTLRDQFTDRYTKAIDQLGSDALEVRIGGIYALEQIGNESPRDRDGPTVMEVLSAFVRVHTDPVFRYRAARPGGLPVHQLNRNSPIVTAFVATLEHPEDDVEAALTVLGRMERLGDSRVRLHGADLRGANLQGAKLKGAELMRTDLRKASFIKAELIGANFYGAQLEGAYFEGADVHGASLLQARGLRQDQMDTADGDGRTTIPPKLVRPSRWSKSPLAVPPVLQAPTARS